jgi:single-stranded DNA-binding protein
MTIEAALFGTLGRDAERKTSKNGRSYLRLNIACSEGDATQWISATVFDERALAAADKLVKGARVYLEGRLSLHEWTASDGTMRTGLSVLSWHCRLAQIGRAKTKSEKPKAAPQTAPASDGAEFDDEIPTF